MWKAYGSYKVAEQMSRFDNKTQQGTTWTRPEAVTVLMCAKFPS